MPLLILRDIHPNSINLWMDFNGNFDVKDNLVKVLSSWTQNGLGSHQFTVFGNLGIYLYIKLIYILFGIQNGTYYVFYFLVLLYAATSLLLVNTILPRISWFLKVVLASFFLFSPVFLLYVFDTGTISLIFSFTVINLLLFLAVKHYQTNQNFYLSLLVLVSVLIPHPFIFVFLFAGIIIYLLLIRKSLKLTIITGLGMLLVSSYWIFPFISSAFFSGSDKILGRYTDDLIKGYAEAGSYFKSFVFLGRNYLFLEKIFPSLLVRLSVIISLFSLWGAVLYRLLIARGSRNKLSLNKLVVAISLLLLLIFSIGPRDPFGFPFLVFYKVVPFFSLFRSYHNIFIIIFSFVAFLLLYFARVNKMVLKQLILISLVFLLAFLFFANNNSLSKSTQIPDDYWKIKQIVDQDKDSSKIMLFPYTKYDFYRWDNGSQDKYFLESFFANHGLIYYRPTMDNYELEGFYLASADGTVNLQKIRDYGVKYILVRKDLLIQHTIGKPPVLNATPIFSSENVDLYKIDNTPLVNGESVKFTSVNPNRYEVTVSTNKDVVNLSLLESFNTGWRIYSNSAPAKENTFITGDEFSLLRGQNQVKAEHTELGYANNWKIDLTDQANAKFVTDNGGNKELRLSIVFYPQLIFLVSLLLSALSVFFVIVITIWLKFKNASFK